MLESIFTAVILLVGMLIGTIFGWWLRSKLTLVDSNPTRVSQLETELRDARQSETAAQIRLEESQDRLEREKKRLDEIRVSMENTFKAMAADIAQTNAKNFLEQANQQFNSLKESSEKDLDKKKGLIDKSLLGMNEKLNLIHQQSTELNATTKTLNEDTARLRAILSSSQQRGQWGERMVEDILQSIGLMEHINYTRQESVTSGGRPDFTFFLPKEKKLNMDVKFPLVHYENYLSAEDETTRAQEKNAFLKDVRSHIKTVSGREYIDPAAGTLEYVMLFIPNESIYGFINSEDHRLIDDALQNHVLLCSPLTLYAMLSLIHQAAQNFTMNERASEVMNLVAEFRKQWQKYVEQMDKLGRRIEGLTDDFQTLVTTRTRSLDRPLDKIDNMSLTSMEEDEAVQLGNNVR